MLDSLEEYARFIDGNMLMPSNDYQYKARYPIVHSNIDYDGKKMTFYRTLEIHDGNFLRPMRKIKVTIEFDE